MQILGRCELEQIEHHYGLMDHISEIKSGKINGVDFMIGAEEEIEELTANLAGFGCDKSKRIIIEYDKGFGYFMVKQILMEYGTPQDVPPLD